jgi:hypothetical protein
MELLSNEVLVSEFRDKQTVLTSKRIIFFDDVKNPKLSKTIFLNKVGSVSYEYKSKVWILLVGFILLAVSAVLIFDHPETLYSGLLGIVFIVVYYQLQSWKLIINSTCGTKIQINTKGNIKDDVLKFFKDIQEQVLAS